MNEARLESLLDKFSELPDPRLPSNGMRHNLSELLIIAVCAVLSSADSFEEIVWWGQTKEAWLRRFLKLENGIPSADTFIRLFRRLDPTQLERIFRDWTGDIVGALKGQVAVDGKQLRGSGDKDRSPIHMVSAFATELGIALGQEKVAEKSNEIKAIPRLLEAFDLKGVLISCDAMGCQKAIAQQILTQGGDYLLAVKGNQGVLHEWAVETIRHVKRAERPYKSLHQHHGRTTQYFTWTTADLPELVIEQWPGCQTIGAIASSRTLKGKIQLETRYFISSRRLNPEQLLRATRAHWAIENRLHWVLDVCFSEDLCTVRKDHAPQNLSLLKKIVINLIRQNPEASAKTSLRLNRRRAGWDDDVRAKLLGLKPI